MTFNERYPDMDSTSDRPSSLVEEVLNVWPLDLEPLLAECDYKTTAELSAAYMDAWMRVAADRYLNNRSTQTSNPKARILLQRANKIVTAADMTKRAAAAAEGLWLRRYERKELERRRNAVFSGERNGEVYLYACNRIRSVYGFNDTEMEHIRYFVCQARRDDSDPALNRALYVYSAEKMTGKTTVARIIAGVLNGCRTWDEVRRGTYMSDIPCELQFGTFDRPKATRFACVVMDEAFAGKTTAKYYGKFKTAMTSDSCTVQIKFGAAVDIPCTRNYIFTSNNDIASVVADESERRMAAVVMRKPEQMAYTDIFALWYDYITNAPGEEDVAKWYRDTMPEVKGEVGITIDDLCSAFLSPDFLRKVEDYATGQDTAVAQELNSGRGAAGINRYQLPFPKFFNEFMMTTFDVRKNPALVKEAALRCFGEPRDASRRRYYNISEVRDTLVKALYNGGDYTPSQDETAGDDDLPY